MKKKKVVLSQKASSKKKVTKTSLPIIKKVEGIKIMKSRTVLLVGSTVPTFSMRSTDGDVVSNASLRGKKYVLYFYPKDMTSGCTIEAHEFTELGKKFASRGILVYGVSADSIESHHKFMKKEGISFPLLSDESHFVLGAFGVWIEKSMYGRTYMGIERSTFVVDEKGIIVAIYRKVSAPGHAFCVLKDIT